MKHLALALALACSCSLAVPVAPAAAADESSEAIISAAQAAETGRKEMGKVFGKTTLKAGQYLWKKGREGSSVDRVVVDLTHQLAYVYNGEELIGATTISSGVDKHPSPVGIFEVLQKKPMHRSIKYDNAPMPFMQRIDEYGIALHAGQLPGRPASHGCVRLPRAFAERLYGATELGTQVLMGKPALLADLRSKGYQV